MEKIAELLALRGPLTLGEILSKLLTWTVCGAALHQEPLAAAMIR